MTVKANSKPRRRRRNTQSNAGMLFLKGLLSAVALTAALILVFALIVGLTDAADGLIRMVNQAIKIAAILLGVWIFVPKGQMGGALRGALMGFTYMVLGLILYIGLTHQQSTITSCLMDVLMGVSIGGLGGMLRSQQSG